MRDIPEILEKFMAAEGGDVLLVEDNIDYGGEWVAYIGHKNRNSVVIATWQEGAEHVTSVCVAWDMLDKARAAYDGEA